MKILTKFIFFLLIAFTGNFSLQAQQVEGYIPANSFLVARLDLAQMNTQVDFNELGQIPLIRNGLDMGEVISVLNGGPSPKNFLKDPGAYGIQLLSHLAISMDFMPDGRLFSALYFPLSSREAFTHFLEAFFPEDIKTQKGISTIFIETDDAETFEMSFAWNEEIAMLASIQQLDNYGMAAINPGQTQDLREQSESIRTILEKILTEGKSSDKLSSPVNLAQGPSNDFSIRLNGKHLDAGKNLNLLRSGLPVDAFPSDWEEMIIPWLDQMLFSNTVWEFGGSFRKGNLHLNSGVLMNPTLFEIVNSSADARIRRKLARFIPGDEVLGYYAGALNIENLIDGLVKLLMPTTRTIPILGNAVEPALDVLGIAIDQEALYGLMKGDLLVSLNGFERVVTEEVYYDEEFQSYTRTTESRVPHFNLVMSVGDRENFRKILFLGTRAGLLIPQKADLYKVAFPLEGLPEDIYVGLKKRTFLITTDRNLAEANGRPGYKRTKRPGKSHKARLRKNIQTVYVDLPSLNASQTGLEETNGNQPSTENKLSSLEIVWPRQVSNPWYTHMNIGFSDKQRNSLAQLLELLNASLEPSFNLLNGGWD